MAFVTILTLGLYAVLRRSGERHFIRRMDDTGVVTRGGRRIAWSEFTDITHMTGNMGGDGMLSDEYLLKSPRGRVSLPLWRAVNADAARDYLLQRLPRNLPGLSRG
jgi:hypothetical protein